MTVIDRLNKALGDLGFYGALPDRMFKHLGSLGHTGAMNDRLSKEGGYQAYVASLINAPTVAPVITLQPLDVTVDEGTPWSISSAASGATSSEWFKDAVATGNTTNTIGGIGLVAESGSYLNRYTNVVGSTDTTASTVAITPDVYSPRVFINLGDASATANYVIGTPLVASGDFEISYLYVPYFGSNCYTAYSGSSSILNTTDGSVRLTGSTGGLGVSTSAGAVPNDAKLHKLLITRVGSTTKIFLDGVQKLSSSKNLGTITFSSIGIQSATVDFRNIIADFRFVNGASPTTFLLDQLTANTEDSVEANNSVTYYAVNGGLPTRETFTLNGTGTVWTGNNGTTLNVA